jgi:hypothetical protein
VVNYDSEDALFYTAAQVAGDPKPIRQFDQILGPAFRKFGIKSTNNWHETDFRTIQTKKTVSNTFYDDESHTLLVAVSDNAPVKELGLQAPFHSEIWVTQFAHDIANVKYIIRSEITNEETINIIKDARSVLLPSNTPDSQELELKVAATSTAEKEAFMALAGSDNGRSVFRMLTDRWPTFNKKKVTKCIVWGANRNQNAQRPKRPFLVWVIG